MLLFYIIISIIIFYIIYINYLNYISKKESYLNTIDKLNCSYKCCNFTQWGNKNRKKSKYLPSNYTCNTGCVCLEKQ